MVLVPSAWGRAGPLCSNIVDLKVAECGPDACVVTVEGEVDALTAPELAAVVTAQLAAAALVVIDLDGVRFLGSAGLSVLVQANELATREDHHLRLVCHSRMVNRILDATGLRDQFNFVDTVSEALNAHPNSAHDGRSCGGG